MPGYGFNPASMERAKVLRPDYLVASGTSSDIGPWFFGTGEQLCSDVMIERDLQLLISNALSLNIPFVVSAGGAGNDSQLDGIVGIVNKVARRIGRSLKLAVISGEIDKSYLKARLREGVSMPSLAGSPRIAGNLTEEIVDQCPTIVAQVGPEAIRRALSLGVDGVLMGRSLDSGLYSALPIERGFDEALSRGFGMFLDGDGTLATPMVPDGMFGILRDDSFDLLPLNPNVRATVRSVAAGAMRERSSTLTEVEPGGVVGLSELRIEQLEGDRSVRVSGFDWSPAPYALKLEGVRRIGYRSALIAGVRDPLALSNLDYITDTLQERVMDAFGEDAAERLTIRRYGQNGVLGSTEPMGKVAQPLEIGLLVEVVADTQEDAMSIAKLARSTVLHCSYPGKKATEGNVALPLSPTEFGLGPAFEWSVWHALPLSDPIEPTNISVLNIGGAK
jgi:hypothetical protein